MTMQADEAEYLTFAEVGHILDRSPWTVRLYAKHEGLIHYRIDRRVVVKRSDLDEWRNRDEIKAMLKAGDYLKSGGRTPYANHPSRLATA